MSGILYVVASPIGNLDDLSPRAARTLEKVGIIACEDTRHTARLLAHCGVRGRTISYHEHNETIRTAELLDQLNSGMDVALLTDAGTPGVSDPGYRLVRAAQRSGVSVRPIPGPSALLAALSVCGLPTTSFCFFGYLPPRGASRSKALESVASCPRTVVLFESPRRLRELLSRLAERLGSRDAFVAREMTKLHEEHRYGTLPELAQWARETSLRGEFTLVLAEEGRKGRRDAPLSSLNEFRKLTEGGLTRREAVKVLAGRYRRGSRDVYRDILELERADENS